MQPAALPPPALSRASAATRAGGGRRAEQRGQQGCGRVQGALPAVACLILRPAPLALGESSRLPSSARSAPRPACLPGAAPAPAAVRKAPAGAARAVQVRVADADAEWTVSRRFRNFEALHRALRGVPAYRLRLPAKRIFPHNQSGEFVEERRRQLDAYLGAVLADAQLAGARPARARRACRDPAPMRGGGAPSCASRNARPACRGSRREELRCLFGTRIACTYVDLSRDAAGCMDARPRLAAAAVRPAAQRRGRARAGEKEVWEFLSAWSEVYGMECESSFLSSVSASIRGANSSVRPAAARAARRARSACGAPAPAVPAPRTGSRSVCWVLGACQHRAAPCRPARRAAGERGGGRAARRCGARWATWWRRSTPSAGARSQRCSAAWPSTARRRC